MKGQIFNIQRFCVEDGPGIRTTVFLKGCPLHCAWCHNPESQSGSPQILFSPEKCLLCGFCVSACPSHCHTIQNETHAFLRENCHACGACTQKCFSGALEFCGKTVSAEEVMVKVRHDLPFFRNSGGGITLSGGEPLAQPDFSLFLLHMAKSEGIHTCVETCGYAPTRTILAAATVTDCFLYDYKLTDESLHRRYTGVSSHPILENLRALQTTNTEIILRCPMIPEININRPHFDAIATLARELPKIISVDFLTYHPLGTVKARRIGMDLAYAQDHFLNVDEIKEEIMRVHQLSGKPCTCNGQTL